MSRVARLNTLFADIYHGRGVGKRREAADGFAALADLDSNGDGVIDASDTAWTKLKVMRWTDKNDNGVMDAGEERLVTLADSGVGSLNTGFVNSNHVDDSGNEHRQVGSYTKTDGTTATMLYYKLKNSEVLTSRKILVTTLFMVASRLFWVECCWKGSSIK